MAFNDLPEVIKNLYIANIELGLKIVLMVFLVWGCIKLIGYVKNTRDNQKTPYLLVAYIRAWLGVISYIVLFLSPLMAAFLFYPTVNMETFHVPLVIIYYLSFFVITIIFIINVLFFSGSMLLRFAGFDPYQEKTNKVLNDLEKMSGMKLGNKKLIKNFMRGNQLE